MVILTLILGLLGQAGERIPLRLINGANARIFSPHIEGLPANIMAVDGRPVTNFFALDRFVLSPGNRIDLDIRIPEQAGGKIFAVEDQFTRKAFQLASIKMNQSFVDLARRLSSYSRAFSLPP